MIEGNKNQIIINNYFHIPEKYKNDILNYYHPFLKSIENNGISEKKEYLKKGTEKIKTEEEISDIKVGINNENYRNKEDKLHLEKTNELSTEKNTELIIKNLFYIKSSKKAGRKPKTSKIKGSHTKFSKDNILRKVRVKFLSKLINYLNSIILSKYFNKIKTFKPLVGKIAQNNKINFNKNLLNSKLKDIFSSYEINGKFTLCEKNYNKSIVDKIYEQEIKELIDILEMTFFEVFTIFRDLGENQKLKGLEKIDSVLREIREKEDNDINYIHDFQEAVVKYESFYFNKIGRKEN